MSYLEQRIAVAFLITAALAVCVIETFIIRRQ
jgi:hypothetical protein